MPRALWSGSLSFGLVNVPVQLVSAARDLDYHFHQLHEKDKVPIEQRRFCSKDDVEVIWEEVAHSYDLDGKQVVITDEELASVQPRKTRTIDIEAFVDAAIVEELSTDWDPERYADCYRERLRRVIDAKRKRRTIKAPEPEREPEPMPDLMAALEQTLENLRAGEPARA